MNKDVRDFAKLVNALGLREIAVVKKVSGGRRLASGFDCNAEEFLQFAEDAFELGDLSQALSEAKRAIYCQVDEVLQCLGYAWKRKTVSSKLTLLKQCGFAAPRILKRVSDARNLLEHEYKRPSKGDAEEALDIATLFVSATRRYLEVWDDEFTIGNTDEEVDLFHFSRELSFGFDSDRQVFEVSALTDVEPEETRTHRPQVLGEIEVSSTRSLFPLFVRLTVGGDRDDKNAITLHEIFDLVRK
jgi:HEPN domain-containing protein